MSSERLLQLMGGAKPGRVSWKPPKQDSILDSPDPAAIISAKRQGAEEATAALRKEFNEELSSIQSEYQGAMQRLRDISQRERERVQEEKRAAEDSIASQRRQLIDAQAKAREFSRIQQLEIDRAWKVINREKKRVVRCNSELQLKEKELQERMAQIEAYTANAASIQQEKLMAELQTELLKLERKQIETNEARNALVAETERQNEELSLRRADIEKKLAEFHELRKQVAGTQNATLSENINLARERGYLEVEMNEKDQQIEMLRAANMLLEDKLRGMRVDSNCLELNFSLEAERKKLKGIEREAEERKEECARLLSRCGMSEKRNKKLEKELLRKDEMISYLQHIHDEDNKEITRMKDALERAVREFQSNKIKKKEEKKEKENPPASSLSPPPPPSTQQQQQQQQQQPLPSSLPPHLPPPPRLETPRVRYSECVKRADSLLNETTTDSCFSELVTPDYDIDTQCSPHPMVNKVLTDIIQPYFIPPVNQGPSRVAYMYRGMGQPTIGQDLKNRVEAALNIQYHSNNNNNIPVEVGEYSEEEGEIVERHVQRPSEYIGVMDVSPPKRRVEIERPVESHSNRVFDSNSGPLLGMTNTNTCQSTKTFSSTSLIPPNKSLSSDNIPQRESIPRSKSLSSQQNQSLEQRQTQLQVTLPEQSAVSSAPSATSARSVSSALSASSQGRSQSQVQKPYPTEPQVQEIQRQEPNNSSSRTQSKHSVPPSSAHSGSRGNEQEAGGTQEQSPTAESSSMFELNPSRKSIISLSTSTKTLEETRGNKSKSDAVGDYKLSFDTFESF